MSASYGIEDLAIETALIVRVEQITGGARIDCAACSRNAVLYVTSEPDMEPGPVCAEHGHEWINTVLSITRSLFPPEGEG